MVAVPAPPKFPENLEGIQPAFSEGSHGARRCRGDGAVAARAGGTLRPSAKEV
jgi:hypothetical protein